jgi:2-polyprenyl-3-methyl-5-hydroxy-6-metoxy-1,4-benzoquinol methylase
LKASLERLSPFHWHFSTVSVPRAERISSEIVRLMPKTTALLDVGCGDGSLVKRVAAGGGVKDFCGVDIKLQPNLDFDARMYDGHKLPFESASFDTVTISDVLHHADSPANVLTEALRVTRPGGAVIVKDHFRLGRWSNGVLLAMDVIGNYAQGILVTGNYLSPTEWVDLIGLAGGTIDKLVWPFRVHDLPFRLVTRSEYQFVARIVHRA